MNTLSLQDNSIAFIDAGHIEGNIIRLKKNIPQTSAIGIRFWVEKAGVVEFNFPVGAEKCKVQVYKLPIQTPYPVLVNGNYFNEPIAVAYGSYLIIIDNVSEVDIFRDAIICKSSTTAIVAQPILKPNKIAFSPFPGNIFQTLKKIGITDLKQLNKKNNLKLLRSELQNIELENEILQLNKYLQHPGINYGNAVAMFRKANRLNEQPINDKVNINILAADGEIAADPLDETLPCVQVGTLSGIPDPLATEPIVDWFWYDAAGDFDHEIITRPWWASPDNFINGPNEVQDYWYPDPNKGWRVFGYQFGGSPGQIGYLLCYNVFTGVMRLFVYLPNVESRNFNKLIATFSIVNADRIATQTWNFPLMDVPPEIKSFQTSDTPTADNVQEVTGYPGGSAFIWPGLEMAFHDLTASSASAPGKWLRTELATLFDPALYPETQILCGLGGCLGLLFPGIKAPTSELQERDRRLFKIDFNGILEGQTNLTADLELTASGTAKPVAQESSTSSLGIDAEYVAYAKKAIQGASIIGGFISTTVATGGLDVMSAVKAAGGIYALFQGDENPDPSYDVQLIGAVTGKITGRTVFVLPVADFVVNLNGTFKAVTEMTNNGPVYFPTGWPHTYQRCNKLRLGAIGFRPAGEQGQVLGVDPRPANIHVGWIPGDEFATFYNAVITISPIGLFQIAPWSNTIIDEQYAELELFEYNGNIESDGNFGIDVNFEINIELPHKVTTLRRLNVNEANTFLAKEISFLNNLKPTQRLRIRWIAKLSTPNNELPPFIIHYALDLAGKFELNVDDQDGTGNPPDDDY